MQAVQSPPTSFPGHGCLTNASSGDQPAAPTQHFVALVSDAIAREALEEGLYVLHGPKQRLALVLVTFSRREQV